MIGYDNYDINHQLLVALPFVEMVGPLAYDIAKPHHKLTLTGTPPTWNSLVTGFPYIAFDGAADYLQCPAADSADLNFTTEDFTLLAWLYNTGPAGTDTVMCQAGVDVSGWEFDIDNTGQIALRTNQAAAHTEVIAAGAFTSSAWQLIGVTRDGAAGQFYVDGLPVTTTGTLTDAVSCAGAKKFLIGVLDGEAANFWAGNMALPRIWDRKLSDSHMLQIFNTERHWYNV